MIVGRFLLIVFCLISIIIIIGYRREIIMQEITKEQVLEVPVFLTMMSYVENNFMNTKIPETLFHYTDINGFIGMFDNSEFWFSDLNYLNDREEWDNGCSIFENLINNYCALSNVPAYKNFFDCLRKKLDEVKEKNRVFVMSFCEDGDLLSQWRGYGNRGGISIGFSTKEIPVLKCNNKQAVLLHDKILYDDAEKERLAEKIIGLGVESKFLKSGGEDLVADVVSEVIRYVIPLFKNSSFFAEKEYRWAYRSYDNNEVCFRERNGMLLPFVKINKVDIDFNKAKFDIDKIIIGPQKRQQEVCDGVKYYLECKGYEDLVEKVELSSIPYRY